MTNLELNEQILGISKAIYSLRETGKINTDAATRKMFDDLQMVQNVYEAALENALRDRVWDMSNSEIEQLFEKHKETLFEEYALIQEVQNEIEKETIEEYNNVGIQLNSEEELEEVENIIDDETSIQIEEELEEEKKKQREEEAKLQKLAETSLFKKSSYNDVKKFLSGFKTAREEVSIKTSQLQTDFANLQQTLDSKLSMVNTPDDKRRCMNDKLCIFRNINYEQILENNTAIEMLGITSKEQIVEQINDDKLHQEHLTVITQKQELSSKERTMEYLAIYVDMKKKYYDIDKAALSKMEKEAEQLNEKKQQLTKELEQAKQQKTSFLGIFRPTKTKKEETVRHLEYELELTSKLAMSNEKNVKVKKSFIYNYQHGFDDYISRVQESTNSQAKSYNNESSLYQNSYRNAITSDSIIRKALESDNPKEIISKAKEELESTYERSINDSTSKYLITAVQEIERISKANNIDSNNLQRICGLTDPKHDIEKISQSISKVSSTFKSIKSDGIILGDAKAFLDKLEKSPVEKATTNDVDNELGTIEMTGGRKR